MIESEFENELTSLYQAHNEFGPTEIFATQVERRWSRRRTARTIIIGVCSAVGAVATFTIVRMLGVAEVVFTATVDGLLALGVPGLATAVVVSLLSIPLVRSMANDA